MLEFPLSPGSYVDPQLVRSGREQFVCFRRKGQVRGDRYLSGEEARRTYPSEASSALSCLVLNEDWTAIAGPKTVLDDCLSYQLVARRSGGIAVVAMTGHPRGVNPDLVIHNVSSGLRVEGQGVLGTEAIEKVDDRRRNRRFDFWATEDLGIATWVSWERGRPSTYICFSRISGDGVSLGQPVCLEVKNDSDVARWSQPILVREEDRLVVLFWHDGEILGYEPITGEFAQLISRWSVPQVRWLDQEHRLVPADPKSGGGAR
jgi:hypothetical protein